MNHNKQIFQNPETQQESFIFASFIKLSIHCSFRLHQPTSEHGSKTLQTTGLKNSTKSLAGPVSTQRETTLSPAICAVCPLFFHILSTRCGKKSPAALAFQRKLHDKQSEKHLTGAGGGGIDGVISSQALLVGGFNPVEKYQLVKLDHFPR